MFSFTSPQTIYFGRGQSAQTAGLAAGFGPSVLLVRGSSAPRAKWLVEALKNESLIVASLGCTGEPSLPALQMALDTLRGSPPDVIVALGGGSVIDFAKALAALICCEGAPENYLEVVGTGRALDHAPVPMIALPTTAGTGAEVTRNAVISIPDLGLKVSLRDARMVPKIAIVDSGLMQGAPKKITLAAGLDALTQVIEPYLSVKANPMSDALCAAAIPVGMQALRSVVENDAPEAWDQMAWVSTCGGLALANAGLGAVHGFAGVIGGRTDAPHGEICGALLPTVLLSHINHAEPQTELHTRLHWVLDLLDSEFGGGRAGGGIAALAQWSTQHGLRGLAELGLKEEDHPAVAEASSRASSMKGNPFALSQADLIDILRAAS